MAPPAVNVAVTPLQKEAEVTVPVVEGSVTPVPPVVRPFEVERITVPLLTVYVVVTAGVAVAVLTPVVVAPAVQV